MACCVATHVDSGVQEQGCPYELEAVKPGYRRHIQQAARQAPMIAAEIWRLNTRASMPLRASPCHSAQTSFYARSPTTAWATSVCSTQRSPNVRSFRASIAAVVCYQRMCLATWTLGLCHVVFLFCASTCLVLDDMLYEGAGWSSICSHDRGIHHGKPAHVQEQTPGVHQGFALCILPFLFRSNLVPPRRAMVEA
eukprot:3712011-Amphidinium_carterae.1